MKCKLEILLIVVIVFPTFCFGQVVQGTLKFQSDYNNYNFINIKSFNEVVPCNSSGSFQLELSFNSDTLEIVPFPAFIKVKIYNLPSNLDTIQLRDIPIFKDIDEGIPIINFKTKRASKKFFRRLEKNNKVEIEKLDKQIEQSVFVWENMEYKLIVIRNNDERTMYINLGME